MYKLRKILPNLFKYTVRLGIGQTKYDSPFVFWYENLQEHVLATPRKNPAELMKKVPGHIKRPHFACRLRTDYWQFLRDECKRLNCSQGVLIELLLKAQDRDGVVTAKEIFAYDSEERRLDVCGEN